MSRKREEIANCIILKVTAEDALETYHTIPTTLSEAIDEAKTAQTENPSLHEQYLVAELKFATKSWHGDYENVPLIAESK